MASPGPEVAGSKRKRMTPSPIDDVVTRPPPPMHPGNVTQINYLMKAKNEKLRLIEGDTDTFGDVLGMIDDYEAVLQRHESLAANLGAKLVGPLLLKSFEKLFDGPIKVIQPSFALEQTPVTWLDIVTFARTNLSAFVLSDSGHGKVCKVWIKGGQIEILEDDYRLIMSGAPERMIPSQPIPEDESSELGTLNILETRLAMLIKKADAVASKARQLNYHLRGRKTAVLARKAEVPVPVSGVVHDVEHKFSPQPFSAINTRSPTSSNGALDSSSKLQADLLEQFLSADHRRNSIAHLPRPKASRVSETGWSDERRMSHPQTASEDGTESQLRVLMAAKIEKLARGDTITPPCDRCRRLKFECTKHLTACSACTKKHAKCSWKDVRDGELEALSQGSPAMGVGGMGETRGNGGGSGDGIGNGFGTSVVGHPGHVAGVERNLDPGFTVDEMKGNVHVSDGEQMDQRIGMGIQGLMDFGPERRAEGSQNEQAILTQIATAAAAAGTQ